MNVLYLESGTSGGGGSFESLFLHLKHIDRSKLDPVVIFFNETHRRHAIEKLGIPVYVLRSNHYSLSTPYIVRWILNQSSKVIADWAAPMFSNYMRVVEWSLISEISRIIKNHDVQLVHLNTNINRDLTGLIAAQKNRCPVISHLRGGPNNSYSVKVNQFLNGRVSRFIANSEATKASWIPHGLDEKKILVVHNAILFYESFAPKDLVDLKQGLFVDLLDSRPLIGCLAASFRKTKGLDVLIDSFGGVLKEFPGAKLVIMGDGQIKGDLEAQARDLGLGEKVVFTGYIPDAPKLFPHFDLFVVPSRQEPFGRVAVEAMATETPIIASKVGGLPEIITHGKTGLLVEPDDIDSLRDAILMALRNPSEARKRAKQAKIDVTRRFSIDHYITKVNAVYDEVVDEKAATSVKDSNELHLVAYSRSRL